MPVTKKISALDQKASLGSTDQIPLVDNSGGTPTTKYISGSDLSGALSASNDWKAIATSISAVTNNGNKSFTLTVDADLSSTFSPGARFKVTRETTAPTQCADLESSSSQYANKTSPTALGLTTTATAEAWIKVESYTGSIQYIAATRSGTAAWMIFRLEADGTIGFYGTASSATTDSIISIQSVPLGRWVHVAASMTINTSGQIYINGVAVPGTYTNGTTTAFGNTGDLAIGRRPDSATEYLDARVEEVRIWNDIRTQTEIRDNMYQQLTGSEANLVGYWKLDGNFNDSSPSGNNLTAQNSATATTVDNAFHDTEYGIITDVTSSTITVFTGTDYGIPNMTLNSPSYSTQRVPYGFNGDRNAWRVEALYIAAVSQSGAASTWYNFAQISVPVGKWTRGFSVNMRHNGASSGARAIFVALGETSANQSEDQRLNTLAVMNAVSEYYTTFNLSAPYTATATTTNYFNARVGSTAASSLDMSFNSLGSSLLYLECAYV